MKSIRFHNKSDDSGYTLIGSIIKWPEKVRNAWSGRTPFNQGEVSRESKFAPIWEKGAPSKDLDLPILWRIFSPWKIASPWKSFSQKNFKTSQQMGALQTILSWILGREFFSIQMSQAVHAQPPSLWCWCCAVRKRLLSIILTWADVNFLRGSQRYCF